MSVGSASVHAVSVSAASLHAASVRAGSFRAVSAIAATDATKHIVLQYDGLNMQYDGCKLQAARQQQQTELHTALKLLASSQRHAVLCSGFNQCKQGR